MFILKKKEISKKKEKTTPAEIRFTKDVTELQENLDADVEILETRPGCSIDIKIKMEDPSCFWHPAEYRFRITAKSDYPLAPPQVLCLDKVFHPNIDYEGNIDLNILRRDWRPVLSLQVVIFGLKFLFIEPNPLDALHQ